MTTTPEAERLADKLKAIVAIGVREHDREWDDTHIQRAWDTIDALAALSHPDEARDAARYRWLRSFATPGQRPAKEDMPMGYREIRLRVDTPVYMPAHWAKDVDRAIDAAMSKEQP